MKHSIDIVAHKCKKFPSSQGLHVVRHSFLLKTCPTRTRAVALVAWIFCSPSFAKFLSPKPRLFFLLKKHDSVAHKCKKFPN